MEGLTNHLHIPDTRGPDHPHMVGMVPVEGDVTVMGKRSASHAVTDMDHIGGMIMLGGRTRGDYQKYGSGGGRGGLLPRPIEMRTRKWTRASKGDVECRGEI